MTTKNEYGQPIGEPAPGWVSARRPETETIAGQYCTLERLNPVKHAADLYNAYAEAPNGSDWTYMPSGPFHNAESYRAWADEAATQTDPRHYAVIDNHTGKALGTVALLRIDPSNGVIEVGFIAMSRVLQRTRISTEVQYLLMRYVFDELGYRRYEWKCDALNAPSRVTATRLGFTYEGTFRQAVVYKGRNRDTAWFSMLDSEWPHIRTAFEAWLDPKNFDDAGAQKHGLRTHHH